MILIRGLLRIWARLGIARGWLYYIVDKYGARLGVPRNRRLANAVLMHCDLRDHIQRQIYFLGAYEPIDAALFLKLLPEGAVVVDAGANIGFYSLQISRKVGVRGKVYSFEPIPRNLRELERNIALSKADNIVVNPTCLWRERAQIRLELAAEQEANAGSFSVATSGTAVESFTAEALTLDEYVRAQGLTRLDAIKMDIEGAELGALEGARATLERFRPLVLLEVCRPNCERMGYSTAALWKFFEALGYSAYVIGSDAKASGWVSDFSQIEHKNVLLVADRSQLAPIHNWQAKELLASW